MIGSHSIDTGSIPVGRIRDFFQGGAVLIDTPQNFTRMMTGNTRKEEDSEDLFDAEDDAFIRTYTQQRVAESLRLKKYTDEEELIARTETETLIVHFYKQGFPKCTALKRALASVAPRFPGVAFASIDVTRAPRMVTALGATVLPLLVFFRNRFLVDGHVGF